MRFMVALHPVQKFLPAFGMADVLNTEVNTLFDVTVAHDLVHNHTDS